MKYTYLKRTFKGNPIQITTIVEEIDGDIKIHCCWSILTLDDSFTEDCDIATVIKDSVEISPLELQEIAKEFPQKFSPKKLSMPNQS